jgi:hypothetical protein
MSDNPLSKFSLKPGMYVKLPSAGKYYATPPTLTADGDIEIHPLTAIDELYLKNPDGLYNNESLYKVINNCIPSFKEPSEILTVDLDVLFISLRIATYGDSMDVSVKCEHCNHIATYTVDLTTLIQSISPMEKVDTIKFGDLTLNLHPYTVETNTRVSEYTMNITRAALKAQESINNDNSEAHRKELSLAINASSHSLIAMTSLNIDSIEMPDGTLVTDQEHISEYIQKLTAPEYTKLRTALNNLSKELIDRTFKFKCEECEKESSGEVSFDPANFFESN